MHATQAQTAPSASRGHYLTLCSTVKPGQHFICPDAPNEVRVLMCYGGMRADEGRYSWAVVVAVNAAPNARVPGTVVKVERTTHVRVVLQARSPVFALEH
jgi:hypothetical protein